MDIITRIADRYEVIRPLGRGSFAQTLLARDTELGRQVAMKVLHPRAARDWKSFELFEREAAVLRDLRHHAIPAVHDAFRAPWDGADAAFLVLEYVEGVSLAQLIADRRHLDPAEVLHLFLEMLGVLDYLHTRVPPILHRDIKPANVIMRSDGSPALVDFGAVRNVFRSADESGSTMVGTYGYMPYEQTMGQANPASDLYALAATILHLVTGRAPPEFMNDAGRLQVPTSLPCGPALRNVLTRMLAAAPADRFPSARAARTELLAAIGNSPGKQLGAVVETPVLPAALTLAPVPRTLTSEMKTLLKQLAYGPGRIMASTEKGRTRWGVTDILLVGFFSLMTAGILPAVVWSVYNARKKRLRVFLLNGLPATGHVLDMTDESIGFEIKMSRVRYEFEVNGKLYRDADQVLPVIARRWDRGTPIQILYLPEDGCDSVIISTS
jgi:protein kinase-like protein